MSFFFHWEQLKRIRSSNYLTAMSILKSYKSKIQNIFIAVNGIRTKKAVIDKTKTWYRNKNEKMNDLEAGRYLFHLISISVWNITVKHKFSPLFWSIHRHQIVSGLGSIVLWRPPAPTRGDAVIHFEKHCRFTSYRFHYAINIHCRLIVLVTRSIWILRLFSVFHFCP